MRDPTLGSTGLKRSRMSDDMRVAGSRLKAQCSSMAGREQEGR